MKRIIVLVVGVVSLSLLSFTTSNSSSSEEMLQQGTVTKQANGNFSLECTPLSEKDILTLAHLEEQFKEIADNSNEAKGFFVRCRTSCGCKFSQATIAGSGCTTVAKVAAQNATHVAAANKVRAQVSAVMAKYMGQ